MKSTIKFALVLLSRISYGIMLSSLIFFVSCDKSDDPSQESTSSSKWMPKNLSATNQGVCVQLNWIQEDLTIDSFRIEKSRDSISWNLLAKLEDRFNAYNDSTFDLGSTYYRICALKGKKLSDYCYASINASCFCDESRFGSLTDSRDGHVYKTIKFDDQVWMAENLAYLPDSDSDSRGFHSDSAPFYYVYGFINPVRNNAKESSNFKTFGVLYNWTAAGAACPSGWHLPDRNEWDKLEKYLSNSGYSLNMSGYKHKYIAKSMASTKDWLQSDVVGAVGNIQLYNNKSCFNGLPGGYFTPYYDKFYDKGEAGYWCSSTCELTNTGRENELRVVIYSLNFDKGFLNQGYKEKNEAFSIRCIKN